MANDTEPDVAIIGGSGFYELIADTTELEVNTPYGPPSGPVTVGTIGERPVAFLARHGRHHEIPPHRIPYRANMWALHQIGIRRVLAPCAVGSLRADAHPGEFLICDQFVDRTSSRDHTYFDGPVVNHVSVADPYCPELRAVVSEALIEQGASVHERGTVVVIEGPRFSTRAESAWYRSSGWDVINMTQYPEVVLARELGLCYSSIAMITDYDTGVPGRDGDRPVTMEAVYAALDSMVATVRAAIGGVVERIPLEPKCGCAGGARPYGTP